MRLIWHALVAVLAVTAVGFAISTITNLVWSGLGDESDAVLSQLAAYCFFIFTFFLQATVIVLLMYWAARGFGALARFLIYGPEHSWTEKYADGSPRPTFPSMVAIVAATGVTAIFFGDVIAALIRFVLAIVSYLFGELPKAILLEVSGIISCVSTEGGKIALGDDGSPIRDCIQVLIHSDRPLLDQAVYQMTSAVGSAGINLPKLVVGAVIFAALLRFIDYQTRRTSTEQKFWAAYAAVAFFAVYLALSSTLSVSLLVKGRDSTVNLDSARLTERIAELAPDISNLEELIAGKAEEEAEPLIFAAASASEAAQPALQLAKRAHVQVGILNTQLALLPQTLKSEALAHYALVESDEFSSREQKLYFSNLLLWAQARYRAHLDHLNTCISAREANIQVAQEISQRDVTVTANLDTSSFSKLQQLPFTGPSLPSTRASFSALFASPDANAARLTQACFAAVARPSAPPSLELGASLGIVGKATSWLLATQSLELTLVVGLVGYGVLGALISRFAFADRRNFQIDQPIEFAVIALVGFVAALVVFVGSFGGMYILSADKAEPNPYAVFALCMGGALFSNRVWERLRTHLGLPADGADDGAGGEGGGEGDPASS